MSAPIPFRPMTRRVMMPGHSAPAAGFEAPFDMLSTCHERVERMLRLQARLQQHLVDKGLDDAARQAARDVMRYFDLAAPLHHEDEELHVFPVLLAGPDAALHAVVRRLIQDHRQMELGWQAARRVLSDIADALEAPDAPATSSDVAASTAPIKPYLLSQAQTDALQNFAALYGQHLKDENELAYPAAQAMLSPQAVQAMSEDMMQRRGVPVHV